MKIYLLGGEFQTMRVKLLQCLCILYLYMFYQVFSGTRSFAQQKHYLLLYFLKYQVLERDNVYLIERCGQILSKLLSIRYLKKFRWNNEPHFAMFFQQQATSYNKCHPRIGQFRAL